jgi:methionyl-tRNA synthetase
MIERYNSDLANTLGNLVNRTVAMSKKYFDGKILPASVKESTDDDLICCALNTVKAVDKNFNEFKIADAVENIMALARRSNKYIDETMPWALAKDENKKERLASVLYNLLESIRFIGVLLQPIMPETSKKIFEQLGTEIFSYDSLSSFGALKTGTNVGTPVPLFSRIDAEKKSEEIKKITDAQKKEAQTENQKIQGVAKIAIDEFQKVDLRAAKIVACEPIKRAKKLLKLTLDDGSGTPRTVASGIAPWYKTEDLIGKTIIVVANLKPATLCGVESNGMILAADAAENDVKVIFLEDVPAGAKIR